jgi:RNA 2',3'-cyclic 3'-phosphodiesterase
MSRLFIAIQVPEKLVQEILEWEKRFSDLPVRWTKPENLHITLMAPWEETDVERAKEILRSFSSKLPSMEITFEQVKYGPHARELSLVWALGESSPGLKDLRFKLQAAYRKFDVRPFRLHLTLARFPAAAFATFERRWLDETVEWKMRAEYVALFESHLHPEGVEYEVLERVALELG